MDLLSLVLLAGFLALDRGPFLQSLVSRPLPAALLAGMLLGDAESGMLCGLLLEPLWLMRLPVGGVVPPNETVAALVGTAAAAGAVNGWEGLPGAALGVVLALPFGWLAMRMDTCVRRINGKLLTEVRREAKMGTPPHLGRAVAWGAFHFAFASMIVVAVGAYAAHWAAGVVSGVLDFWGGVPFVLLGWALPAVGAGAILAGLPGWRTAALFCLGAAGGWAGGRIWRV